MSVLIVEKVTLKRRSTRWSHWLKVRLSSIGLHVFGQNIGAQTSYRKLGYGVTSVNMLKHLGPALA